ncbi:hypothetical protein O181_005536 [Austropuccinia psidii MF-1]|uniref:Uncharacterized protein n=1 Tax=Austropuccinia psidii MF-1 TaxID=1389203 RepID=A0A9Q3GFZ5_9BASI|nr:hypothetical protein [Austropuccinia psidii MF-1]
MESIENSAKGNVDEQLSSPLVEQQICTSWDLSSKLQIYLCLFTQPLWPSCRTSRLFNLGSSTESWVRYMVSNCPSFLIRNPYTNEESLKECHGWHLLRKPTRKDYTSKSIDRMPCSRQ